MQSIIGQEAITQFFTRVIAAGQLSHAYLFVGPEHVGKYTFGLALAAELLHTTPVVVLRNPDLYIVRREQDEKTQKTKKNIDIDQIRDMRSALGVRSMYGGYKVAIIEQAALMSVGAANALLKTLEEPRGQTVLILMTDDEAAIPATIRSRTQPIQMYPVPDTTLRTYMQTRGMTGPEAETMVRSARGLPGQLIRWLEEPELFTAYQDQITQFTALVGQPFYQKRQGLTAWFSESDDPIAQRQSMIESLSLWRLLVSQCARHNYGVPGFEEFRQSVSSLWTREKVLATDRAIAQAIINMEYNVNPRLLVEQVLLAMP